MYERVRLRFYGIEDEFDKWWLKDGGGYDVYYDLKIKYPCWIDPLGKIKKKKLIQTFNKYIKDNNLE